MFRIFLASAVLPFLLLLGIFFVASPANANSPIALVVNAPASDSLLVFNLAEEDDRRQFQDLHLDADHPNLLMPGLPAEEFKVVQTSWVKLHQGLGNYLERHGFEWEVADRDISILHKIYFTPTGVVKKYCFKVMNKEVTTAKTEAFSVLAAAYFKEGHIDLVRPSQFAQCGKTRYPNRTSTSEEKEE